MPNVTIRSDGSGYGLKGLNIGNSNQNMLNISIDAAGVAYVDVRTLLRRGTTKGLTVQAHGTQVVIQGTLTPADKAIRTDSVSQSQTDWSGTLATVAAAAVASLDPNAYQALKLTFTAAGACTLTSL